MVLCASAFVLGTAGAGRAAPEAGLRITLAGSPVVVFDSERDGCAKDDIPDLPLRAARLSDGSIIAIASEWHNRLFKGRSLDSVKRDCRIVYQGAEKDAPESFDDRGWLSGLWTQDGRTIYALVHNEYQAHRHPGRCPIGQYLPCWYNSVIFAKSTDGGGSFERPPDEAALVAAPAIQQDVGQGKQRGFMSPSNIVFSNDYWYAFVFTPGYAEQRPGACLLRTGNIADPASWRAWDGAAFSVKLDNPYKQAAGERKPHCLPVAPFPRVVDSIVRFGSKPLWIAVYTAAVASGKIPQPGVYYSVSQDLTNWSAPELIMALPMNLVGVCASKPTYLYASLLDPHAATRSFEDTGGRAYLFMTRSEVADCHQTMHRELVRWPIKIDTTP
jgi:hypothetical protein